MSMPRAVRHINEIRALEALLRRGGMSRADLARQLGLTRSTASSIVNTLTTEGLVIEDEEQDARDNRAGRPGTLVRLRGEHGLFIGVELGVGRLSVVALDFAASVVAERHETFAAAETEPERLAARVADQVDGLCKALGGYDRLHGICVAVPGAVDREGRVMRAPLLGWRDVAILPMIAAHLSKRPLLTAENDANAFAMAEVYRQPARPGPMELYVFLDAGLGGAILAGGETLRGHGGYAGEFGHVLVGQEGFVDMATLPGSLETFVGREAVLARHRFHGGGARDIAEFLELLEMGEAAARATLADWAHYLGLGLAALANILDPGRIVLGGPVAALYGHCREPVAVAMARHVLIGQPLPEIVLSELGHGGPAIGAACLLHKRLLSVDQEIVFGAENLTSR